MKTLLTMAAIAPTGSFDRLIRCLPELAVTR